MHDGTAQFPTCKVRYMAQDTAAKSKLNNFRMLRHTTGYTLG